MKLFTILFLLVILLNFPVHAFNNRTGDFEAGSSQYLSIADAAQTGLDLTTFTFAMWIKLESEPPVNNYSIVSKRAANNQQWRFYYSISEVPAGLYLTTGDTDCLTEAIAASKGITLDKNRWYHLAATHLQSGAAEIYIDGVAQGANVFASTISDCTGAFEIGSINGGIQNFDGLIDEVSAWSVVLSPDAIRGLMKKQLIGNETGLVAYYTMEAGFQDLTSNNNDLTNNNAVLQVFDRAFWDSRINFF